MFYSSFISHVPAALFVNVLKITLKNSETLKTNCFGVLFQFYTSASV